MLTWLYRLRSSRRSSSHVDCLRLPVEALEHRECGVISAREISVQAPTCGHAAQEFLPAQTLNMAGGPPNVVAGRCGEHCGRPGRGAAAHEGNLRCWVFVLKRSASLQAPKWDLRCCSPSSSRRDGQQLQRVGGQRQRVLGRAWGRRACVISRP
jgi:hypothetical protein